jgi:hypothetical protein
MFPIANLIVDDGCIATTSGSSLFCIYGDLEICVSLSQNIV